MSEDTVAAPNTGRFKFQVVREEWDRGRGEAADAKLLGPYGLCCLGFLGRACGYSEDDIAELGLPEEVINFHTPRLQNRWPESIVAVAAETTMAIDSHLTNTIVSVNDDNEFTDEFREEQLRLLFDSVGIDVEFVNRAG